MQTPVDFVAQLLAKRREHSNVKVHLQPRWYVQTYRLNNHDAIVTAVRQGLGIGLAPVWMFEEDLRAGRVKALLPEHPLPAAAVHLVYPERRLLAKRTRTFMDTIDASFASNESLQPGYLDRLRKAQLIPAGEAARRLNR